MSEAIDLEALTVARYPAPEWITFVELRAGTGWAKGAAQRFDVVALNSWPSKRGHRAAFEVKRSRADFMRELDKPEKRAQAERFFSESWFVCAPGVCDVSEVPDGWGLLVATKAGDKLRRVRAARQHAPEDLPYPMMLSILRRADEPANDAARLKTLIAEAEADKRNLRREWANIDQAKSALEYDRKQLVAPLEAVANFARGFGYGDRRRGPSSCDVENALREAVKRGVAKALAPLHRQLREVCETLEAAESKSEAAE